MKHAGHNVVVASDANGHQIQHNFTVFDGGL